MVSDTWLGQRESATMKPSPACFAAQTVASVGLIECKNLWKIYGEASKRAMTAIREHHLGRDEVRDKFNCVVGVADVSFSVQKGETLCIMGLSGSGKSTLLRHINRLIEPTSGEVWIGGRCATTLNVSDLRELRSKAIGMVFQNMALWPHMTVLENVLFALRGRGMRKEAQMDAADRALETVHLDGWKNHYPDQLSGGMQQRVGLARALSIDPEILLMDEPFSALDPIIRRELQEQFIEVSRALGKTAVFITHDLDEAIRVGDRVAIMKNGQIVQTGTPLEIINKPADDYVLAFVRGVSRLHMLTAETVMSPLTERTVNEYFQSPALLTDARLLSVLDALMASELVDVVTRDRKKVGTISRQGLLTAIRSKLD